MLLYYGLMLHFTEVSVWTPDTGTTDKIVAGALSSESSKTATVPWHTGDAMPFFRDQSFDPEAVAAMRVAFRLAWDVLPAKQQSIENQRVLADAILHLAADGERDPERLCAYALTAVPPAKAG